MSIMFCLSVLFLSGNDGEQCTDNLLEKTLANLRANEKRFDRFEFHYTVDYRLLSPEIRTDNVLRSYLTIGHTVRQGSFLFEDSIQTQVLHRDGSLKQIPLVLGFDGTTTRFLYDRVANVISGETRYDVIFHPHRAAVRTILAPYSLSQLLSANGTLAPGLCLQTEHAGTEIINGLECDRLLTQVSSLPEKPASGTWHTWLAKDRNYIPLRFEGIHHNYSSTIPYVIATVDDFREIAPGIWLPMSMQTTVYRSEKISEGEKIPGNVTLLTIDEARADPNYPIEFFRDIEFPMGTNVYVVDSSGTIVDSYVEGDNHPASVSMIFILLGILIGVAAVIAAARLCRSTTRAA